MVTRRGRERMSCASFLAIRCWSPTVPVCCPSPEPGTNWRTVNVQPPFCIGRYEGTDMFLGRRGTRGRLFALAIPYGERASISVWCSHVLAAPVYRNYVRTCDRLSTALGPGTRKKSKKSAHRGSLSLDNRGPHKC